jgi:sigma-B regulation protein RsbU (phosphoserine phosphatase)
MEPGAETPRPLATRNLFVGGVPDFTFSQDVASVAPGATLYVFSDGVFEFARRDRGRWDLDDFSRYMAEPAPRGASKMDALLAKARELAGKEHLEDDFSILEVRLA